MYKFIMKHICKFLWNLSEDVWRLTGLRIFAPIEIIFPHFAPWVFGHMVGSKGVMIKKGKE